MARRRRARTLGGHADIEKVARECARSLPSTEAPILRSVIRYFDSSGAGIDVARKARQNTVDLLLRRIRAEAVEAYRSANPEGAVESYQRRLTYLTGKVRKVFLAPELDTSEVMLAAGLERTRLGALVETTASQGLFGKLHREARAGGGDGRRKTGAAPRKLSLDKTFGELGTLLAVDPDGLWDRLIPWIQGHSFEVIDLEADPDEEEQGG